MHSKYQNIDINHYKTCLQEVGEAAKQRGDHSAFRLLSAEWKHVDEYIRSMESPWSKNN